jgi:ketosteroid isomerase-like protein
VSGLTGSTPDIHYQPIRSLFGEDHVVVELLVTGTLRDGTKTRFHACDILTMRDGLIAAKRSYRKVVE